MDPRPTDRFIPAFTALLALSLLGCGDLLELPSGVVVETGGASEQVCELDCDEEPVAADRPAPEREEQPASVVAGPPTPSTPTDEDDQPAPAQEPTAPAIRVTVPPGRLLGERPVLTGTALVSVVPTTAHRLLSVELTIDGARIAVDSSPPYQLGLDTRALTEGEHLIGARAMDEDGQIAEATLPVWIDNVGPLITSFEPADGAGHFLEDGSLRIAVEVEQPEFVDRVQLLVDGAEVAAFTSPPFTTLLPLDAIGASGASLPVGLTIDVTVTDGLGQIARASHRVSIDTRRDWDLPTFGEIWGGPANFDGDIVLGNRNNTVMRVRSDGSVVWSTPVDGVIDGRPAVAGGRAYLGTATGSIYAINGDGGVAWRSDMGTPPVGDLVVTADTVWVSGFNGTVSAFDAANGSRRWSASLTGQLMTGPGVGPDGTLYAGSLDSYLYAVRDGAVAWSVRLGGEIWSSPTVGFDGTVYVGANDGWLYAIRDGVVVWDTDADGQIWSRPTFVGDAVCVSSTARFVTCFDRLDGDALWRTRTDGMSGSAPTPGSDGLIHVGTTSGDVFSLDPADGLVRGVVELSGAIHGSPVVIGDGLYVGTTDRRLFALRLLPRSAW